ncbi:MAG: OpgD/OpgG family glucan biosynthesis protein [Saccharospirillum sp.]
MQHRQTWPERCLMALLWVTCLSAGLANASESNVDSPSRPFSQAWLHDHARTLAGQPYRPVDMAADNPLRALTYDDYRRIVFDSDAAIWGDPSEPFQLQLFHPGFLHTNPVGVHLVNDGMARRLAFSTDLFRYEDRRIDVRRIEADGFAGFRVHHPINTEARHEEFLVFLGASYFRAVGRDQFYGLSARGLAVNTVGPGGEEFPRFTDVWIERPDSDASSIVIHALLDSPSVTGAYRFEADPGERTAMSVDARLFPRRDLERVGVAPLTSMFFFDATNRSGVDDFRNAAHDSDGLHLLQANGERLWRPLANPRQVQVSAFGAGQPMPVGFGLMQRRQAFADFNDLEARYDKRPSLWIEPLHDWGRGHVELVEIPTRDEYHDNIVAYWAPENGLQAGQAHTFRYRMHWGDSAPGQALPGQIVDTAAGQALGSEERLFVIDYSDADALPDLTGNPSAVRIRASTSAGRITDVSGTRVALNGHYRAYVKFDPGEADLAELRVTLEADGRPWGETWLYRWTP